MKILGYFHGYPPIHNAGAEYMLHAVMKYLQSTGNEIVVLYKMNKTGGVYEGISCPKYTDPNRAKYFDWAEVVFTHLDFSGDAINRTQHKGKKLVEFLHNDYRRPSWMKAYIMLVHNSEWMKRKLNKHHPHQAILRPPIFEEDYAVKRYAKQRHITLINQTENKGARQFIEIAKRMPEKTFLGVLGSYGDQITEDLPNVNYLDNTPDMKKVYGKTKILLMPSAYESWGRTATEAMINGIPVIAHPTNGLRENLADAGIYVDRKNIDGWVDAINKLDDPEEYEKASQKCRERAKELDPHKSLAEFEKALIKYVNSPRIY